MESLNKHTNIVGGDYDGKTFEIRINTFKIFEILTISGSVIFVIFACLKIHGIRAENNKLLGTYLGFRYALFVLFFIFNIIKSSVEGVRNELVITSDLIVPIIYFILDIGLTVILHSIRVDRENSAGTENQMKNF